MGYSRERIRQLHHQAFNKLRTLDRNRALAEYLEME
jgi:DNA-directed RNA polymerase sigma subunit (sigma70/sigma32)